MFVRSLLDLAANSKASELTVPTKYGLRPWGRIQATSPVEGSCMPPRVR
jgi:hypothetical protein